MKTWNKIQFAIILVFVAVGAFVFVSPYFMKKSGVVVVSVSNSGCQNVRVGDIITEVGGNQIADTQDFNSARFQPQQFVSLVVNAGPAGCIALADGSVGIEVKSLDKSGIIYGVDLAGGIKYKIDTSSIPSNQVENISRILMTRTSFLSLADVKIQNNNNQLTIISGKNTNLNQLLFRGNIEGNIEIPITLKNNTGSLQIGSDNYTIQKTGNIFLINNENHALNDSFYLKDVKTAIVNTTNSTILISLTVFNNSDVLSEVAGYTQVSLDANTGKYDFNILVRLSTSAGKRFYDIVQNIKTTIIGNQVSLDSALVFKFDGIELSRLGMPVSLKSQEITTLYIVGSDASKESLLNKKSMVEAAINAGNLPQNLIVSGTEAVVATQQNNALLLIGLIIVFIGIVPLFLAVKYKKFKHNSLSILIGGAEMFSVVSLFIAFQIFYKLNFALDFAALIGLTLLSLNWMVNVASLNLSTHSQRNLILKIKYRKITSVTGLAKILLILLSFVFGAYGYASASAVIFLGVLLDYFIFKSFYKSFVS